MEIVFARRWLLGHGGAGFGTLRRCRWRQGIKGLVFDKDGTLFDFRATWDSWGARLIEDLSATEAERTQLSEVLGFDSAAGSFRADSLVIAGTPGEIIGVIRRLRPADDPNVLMDRIVASTETVPQVEAAPLVPLLARLRAAGLKLGVATNDAESPARAHLRGVGVEDAFDFVAGYDSGFGAKPQPGMLTAFLEVTGLEAQDTAMIGDSTHDLIAGRAAGMQTIAVLTGTAGAGELHPYADITLPSIAHLPDWLNLT